jgi:hypothetical protein
VSSVFLFEWLLMTFSNSSEMGADGLWSTAQNLANVTDGQILDAHEYHHPGLARWQGGDGIPHIDDRITGIEDQSLANTQAGQRTWLAHKSTNPRRRPIGQDSPRPHLGSIVGPDTTPTLASREERFLCQVFRRTAIAGESYCHPHNRLVVLGVEGVEATYDYRRRTLSRVPQRLCAAP